MANQFGRAGKSTRKMAQTRRQSAMWMVIIGLVAIGVIYFLLQNSTSLGISGIGLLVLIVIMRLVPEFVDSLSRKKFIEEKRAIRGAKAEEKIGGLLDDLPEEFYILNDIESPFGNIDHIVISKNTGVFLIETKAHGGKVEVTNETLLVNGKLPEKDFVAQVLRNTYWLRDEIDQIIGSKPWITPVIVFVNAFVSPARPIKGISIVNKKYLPEILHRIKRPNPINSQIWEHREQIKSHLM